MIKFTDKEIETIKELVLDLGIENEEKEHRKYSTFYYYTYYTFEEKDREYFENNQELLDKIIGLTFHINGLWDDSYGLDELSIDINRSVGSKNPDYNTLLDIINNSKESFSDEVFNKIIGNLYLIVPENIYMTTDIPFEVVK
ncbi:hypothetical protein HWB19_gp120 [Cronobacter phage vB_CsaP_009]|uniref:Uncharacterized protein n=1 Tax=Cronobacter phage vB_CsaP_009 TaxID=2699738 RepID=A0A679FE18_9CAUD|nr:hypothetical protein HWB19_gp120 [Cronobacter phage vB_CsaP_009]BBU72766.1 hypothetical protein [Cronobacter phage vB_CsaP_009]